MKFLSVTKVEVLNLEQLRGLNAFTMAEDVRRSTGGGQMTAKKVATQIRENGFLGALAFALERKKEGGFKKSQKGLCWVYRDENGELAYKDGYLRSNIPDGNLLEPVFRDGKLLREYTIIEIRDYLNK